MNENVKKTVSSRKRKTSPKKEADDYQLALDLYFERGGILLDDGTEEWF
jgi:hypothetical protein